MKSYRKYGFFDDMEREFVISRPDTPAPWINYLTNGKYTALFSNTAGGFSFVDSPRDGRITRLNYNSLPVDRPGKYLYIRFGDTGEYYSPTWQPTFTNLKKYECRHGFCYSLINSTYKGLEVSAKYFVPVDDNVEIWSFKIRNNLKKKVKLDLFPAVHLCLGHGLVDLINQPNDQHFNQINWDKNSQILLATKRYWVTYSGATVQQANQAWNKVAVMASDLPVKAFEGSRDNFIGKYRSESNPIMVEEGELTNNEITSGDAVGVLQIPVQINPHREITCSIIFGVVDKEGNYKSAAKKLVSKYRKAGAIEKAFEKVKQNGMEYLSHVEVSTPDDEMNTMLNVWNQYQTWITFNCSRDASYYHGGFLYGRGYRDSCQDILGPLLARRDKVRERILEMAKYGNSDGSVYHCYYPNSGGGEQTGHMDTPLWFPFAVASYIKETGDTSILKKETEYKDGGKNTILGFANRNLEYILSKLSPRKLPLIGPGDWNDTLDYLGRRGKGESIWVGMFLCYVLKEWINLLDWLDHNGKRDWFAKQRDIVVKAINKHAWDGKWYIRATNDNGEVIGSHKCREGKIFLNTQSWAVISGVASPERAIRCMDSARKYLLTPKGPKILHPPYRTIDPEVGLATRCVAGKKENGAVFNHPVSWSILAETILGRGDNAFEYYKKAIPGNPVVDIDRYKMEPYVYSEYITSPDHPTFGQASHAWLTGSSTWMLRDGIDSILGVSPDYNGLKINPVIPSHWKEYRIKREFRGTIYYIEVYNPDGVSTGIKSIEFNGSSLKGNILPIIKGKKKVKVVVIMG